MYKLFLNRLCARMVRHWMALSTNPPFGNMEKLNRVLFSPPPPQKNLKHHLKDHVFILKKSSCFYNIGILSYNKNMLSTFFGHKVFTWVDNLVLILLCHYITLKILILLPRKLLYFGRISLQFLIVYPLNWFSFPWLSSVWNHLHCCRDS